MTTRQAIAARCPLRPGDFCTLCVPGATGPQDCPTVAEVMRDPALRDRLAELRREARIVSAPGPRRA